MNWTNSLWGEMSLAEQAANLFNHFLGYASHPPGWEDPMEVDIPWDHGLNDSPQQLSEIFAAEEKERSAYWARKDVVRMTMVEEDFDAYARDILVRRQANNDRLEQMKIVQKKAAEKWKRKDPGAALQVLDACLMISQGMWESRHRAGRGRLSSDDMDGINLIVLRPKKDANEQFTWKVTKRDLGVRFRTTWAGKRPEIATIRTYGHAAVSNIRPGDIIIEIEGEPTSNHPLSKNLERLSSLLYKLPAVEPPDDVPLHLRLEVTFYNPSAHAVAIRTFTKNPIGIRLGRRSNRCAGCCSGGAVVKAIDFDGQARDLGIEVGWEVTNIEEEVVSKWSVMSIKSVLQERESQLRVEGYSTY